MEYIDANLPPAKRSELRLAVAQVGACVQMDDAAGLEAAICDAVAGQMYTQYLTTIKCIMTQEVRLRTTGNKYGLHAPSERVTENRRSTFRAVCRKVTNADPVLPCHRDTCGWATNVDEVVEAFKELYKTKSSFVQAATMFKQCLRAMGWDSLATEYHAKLEAVEMAGDAPKKAELTPDQVTSIRACVTTAIDDALKTSEESAVQAAIAMGLMWGETEAWRPQRRDMVSYRFKRASSDDSKQNLFDPSTKQLRIVTATKVKMKEAVVIDVAKTNSRLAELLCSISATHPTDLLLFNKDKAGAIVPVAASSLNHFLRKAFERYGLSKELAKRASSCNAARHCDVRVTRKRRALSPSEREEEEKAARQRLSSVRMAEIAYAQQQ
eukprot:COSAG04_NODE_1378_length_7010_cov_3.077268_2_plen_382_part_00